MPNDTAHIPADGRAVEIVSPSSWPVRCSGWFGRSLFLRVSPRFATTLMHTATTAAIENPIAADGPRSDWAVRHNELLGASLRLFYRHKQIRVTSNPPFSAFFA